MLYIPTAAIAFAMALGFSSAQTPQYTRQTLKIALHTANTPAECNRLALYFEDRSIHFKALSEEQGKTLRQELEHPTLGAKYPTAVDRARRIQEYYLEQSREAHSQSMHFKSMARKGDATADER
jgi:hypothetical protein